MNQPRTLTRFPTTSERVDQTKPAYVVVDKFGGLARFCRLVGIPRSTGHDWLVRGLIPAARQERILEVAQEHKVKVKPADFVPTPKVA